MTSAVSGLMLPGHFIMVIGSIHYLLFHEIFTWMMMSFVLSVLIWMNPH